MSKVLLGTYIGLPDNSNTPDPYAPGLNYNAAATNEFNSFSSAMGQTPTLMDTYVDYTLPESQWVKNVQTWAAPSWAADSWSRSLIPVIGIPMASQGENADTSFRNIIGGSEDSIFNGIFQAWADAGYKTMYIRPGHEMNGTWYPWSVTSANAADYVAAFNHIAALAHAFTGASIQVVFNPNVGESVVPVASMFPSGADIVGLDTYSLPNGVDAPSDPSTDPNFFTLLDAINLAKANGKPFALPEVGGLSASFAAAIGNVVANSGVPVSFVNIWDVNDVSGNLSWSNATDNQAAVAAAWKAAFAEISGTSSADTVPATAGVNPTASPTPVATLAVTPANPITTPSGTLVIGVSEDAGQGDVQFTVSVDGTQVGGVQTASVLHSSGDTGLIALPGIWSADAHTVRIQFIGGTAAQHLYVDSIALNGTVESGGTATLASGGAASFSLGGTTAAVTGPADTVTVHLAEDAWNGNAKFSLLIDGKTVSTPQDVVALHSAGAWEDLSFSGTLGAGSHTVAVAFTNDASGVVPGQDRNLYVNGIDVNGQHYGTGVMGLASSGVASFTFSTQG